MSWLQRLLSRPATALSDAGLPAPAAAGRRLGRPPPRHAEVEACEPRILYSAELNPVLWGHDAAVPDAQALVAPLSPAATGYAVASAWAASIGAGAVGDPGALGASAATRLALAVRHEIVFVDAGVEQAQAIVDALLASRPAGSVVEVVQIGAGEDGLRLISEVLAGETALDAVHIVSHGSAGSLQLGRSLVNTEGLQARATEVQAWRQALNEGADLLLWGCDVAAGAQGAAFVDLLAQLSGADVAASDNTSGNAAAGGDWVLERHSGAIQASGLTVVAGFDGSLVIAVSNTTSGQTSSSSITLSHASAGSDRLLLVGVSMHTGAGTVSSITYGGVALYQVDWSEQGNARVEIWALVAPPVGTFNLVTSTTSSKDTIVGAMSFTGVNQASALRASSWNSGSNSSGSISGITSAAGEYVFGVVHQHKGSSISQGSGQTEYWDLVRNNVNGASTLKAATGSSTSLSWGFSKSDDWAASAVSIKAANTAPVLANMALGLTVLEDAGAPVGAVGSLVSSFTSGISDADGGAKGIAITATNTSNGTWYYSSNSGSNWVSVGTVSASSSLLLADNTSTRLYFAPNADYNGSVAAALTFRAWDQTTGSAGSKVSTSSTGGSTAFSSATDVIDVTVTAVNDAPVLADTVLSMTVAEDAGAPVGAVGNLVSNFTGGISDVDSPSLSGIAVTNTLETNGLWYYSSNAGSSWQLLGAVSNSSALLLANNTSTRLYFSPAPDYFGTVAGALTLRAWDQTSGTAGSKVSTSSNGGTTAFSTATDVIDVTVTPVNDAPVMTPAARVVTVAEDAGLPVGAVGSLISSLTGGITDVDDVNRGLAVVASNEANGTWYYSTNAGSNWQAVGSVSASSSLLLAQNASTRIYFAPAADFNGTVANGLTVRAWDRTTGTAGSKVSTVSNGGSTAFSSATDWVSVSVTPVNDAPVIAGWAGDSQTYAAGSGAVVIDVNTPASVSDIDSADFNGGLLTLSLAAGSNPAQDQLGVQHQGNGAGQIGVSGANISFGGVLIGSYSGGTAGANLVVTLNSNAAAGATSALVRSLTFENTDTGNPTPGRRTLRLSLSDGAGATSVQVDAVVQIGSDRGLLISNRANNTSAGGLSWNDSSVVQLGDPGLTLAPGGSAGTFSTIGFDLDSFAADGISNLNGLHYVSRNITVGGANAVALQKGDLLISTSSNEVLGGVSVAYEDIVLFRPSTPGNYSSGSFSILLQAPLGSGVGMRDFALVETSTDVGGTSLAAGEFLLVGDTAPYYSNVTRFQTSDVGPGTTAGTVSTLIDGGSAGIGISQQILGLELVQADALLGGRELLAGQLLLSLNASDTVGSNSLTTTRYDIWVLNASATGVGTSAGTASLLLQGSALGLSATDEEYDAIALLPFNSAPVLNAAASPAFSDQVEDSGPPGLGSGTRVSQLVDFSNPSGQLDNFSDADDDARLGLAVIGANTSNGSWFYSVDDSNSWQALGAVSNTSARLLSADALLYFQPNANYSGSMANAITFRAWDGSTGSNGALADASVNGGTRAFSSSSDSASLIVLGQADTPQVSAASTAEDSLSSGGLVISRNAADGAEVTHFKISGISHGSLFLNDGVTAVADGSFISFAQGNAGLRFAPLANFFGSGSFSVQASTSNSDGGLGGDTVLASITVTPVADTPSITSANTAEDTLSNSGLVISRNAADGSEVTHYQISAISNGSLYLNDGITLVASGSFITEIQGTEGLKFMPASDFNGTAGFNLQASTSGNTLGLGGAVVAAVVNVSAVNDAPTAQITAPSYSATEQTLLTLHGTGLSVGDVDAGASTVQVALTVGEGHLSATAGSTGVVVTDSGSPALTLTGTLAQINALLAGSGGATLTYFNPSDTPAASTTLSLSINDLGNSGSGGSLSSSSSVSINITAVNDAPLLTAATLVVAEGETATLTAGSFSISDPDSSSFVFSLGNISGGYFQLSGAPGVAITSFSSAQLAAGQVQFVDDGDELAPAFDVKVNDGGLDSNTLSAGVSFINVNDAPTITAASLSLLEGQTLTLSPANFSISDPDSSSFDFSLSLVLGGYFQLSSAPGVAISSFSSAELAAALVQFVDDGNEVAPSFSVTVNDGTLDSNTFAATINYTPVNDAPTISNGAMVTLAGTDEDTASSGTTADSILSSAAWADVDTSPLKGLAITAVMGNGTWQYSTDGSSWAGFGPVSPSHALLLDAGTQVRYQPDGASGESASFSFKAWDQSTGTASSNGLAAYANPGTGGGSTAYSSQAASANITVASVNDAPVLSSSTALPGIHEDAVVNNGFLVSSLAAAATDVDTGAVKGLGIAAVDDSHGVWQFTLDGSSWVPMGAVAVNNVRLLPSDGTARIRFVPDADWNGVTGPLSYLAWDQSSGSPGALADASVRGGSSAFSTGIFSSTLTVVAVNDAPTALGASVSLVAVAEDSSNPPGATVGSLFAPVFSDALDQVSGGSSADAFAGVAVVANAANAGSEGAWQWFDGASWADIGNGVSSANALTLLPTTGLRFLPKADYNGTPGALTVRLVDASAGALSNGASVNLGAGGGTSAYSGAGHAVVLDTSITPVNDAPVITAASLTLSEGQTVTLAPANFGISDPDSTAFIYTLSGVTGGYFQLSSAPAVVITSFSSADLTGGLVQFVDDGNEVAPSFSVTVNDGALDSNTFAATINYTPVNNAPVLTAANLTLNEGATVTLSPANFGVSDPDSSSFVYTVSGVVGGYFQLSTAAAVAITSFSSADLAIGLVQFVDDGNEVAPAFNVSVNDGELNSNTRTAAIQYTPVNDDPQIMGVGNPGGPVLVFVEGAGAQALDVAGTAQVLDVDNPTFAGGRILLSFITGSNSREDELGVLHQGLGAAQVGVSGQQLLYGGVVVGSFSGGSQGQPLDLRLNAQATPAAASALLRQLSFRNNNAANPSEGLRTLSLQFFDGSGGQAAPAPWQVQVVAENDAPLGRPLVRGLLMERQTLTADTSAVEDPDGLGAFSYQWLRNGLPIDNATAASYTLGRDDVGGQVQLLLRWVDGLGKAESLISTSGERVAKALNGAQAELPAEPGKAHGLTATAATEPDESLAETGADAAAAGLLAAGPFTAPALESSFDPGNPGDAKAASGTPLLANVARSQQALEEGRPGAAPSLSFELTPVDMNLAAAQDKAAELRDTLRASSRGSGTDHGLGDSSRWDLLGRDHGEEPEKQLLRILTSPQPMASAGLTAGAMWWLSRSGGLLSSILMGVPAWRHVDLLPVMSQSARSLSGANRLSANGDDAQADEFDAEQSSAGRFDDRAVAELFDQSSDGGASRGPG